MKQETYDRIKADFPLLFTATVVSVIAQTFYEKDHINLFSNEGFFIIGNALMGSLVACGIIYGFYKGLVWWRQQAKD